MKLIIQIPCYNEEETLAKTLSELPKHIDGIDIIETLIIDDCSNDKSIDIANWNGVNHIIKLKKHTGLAGVFKIGINEALNLGADIIVNTDADNQYCADDIETIIKPIISNQADIVIGARPIESVKSFSTFKKCIQKFGSFIVRLLSSTNVQDAPSGFRAFSKYAASVLNVFDNYTYTLETIIQAQAKGLRVISVPIRVNEVTRKSKLVKNLFQYIKNSTFTIIRMFIIYRPFRFFAIIASIFLLLGLILGFRFLYYYMTGFGTGHVQSLILASILILTGFHLGIFAILADLLSINRKLSEDIQLRLKKLENKR